MTDSAFGEIGESAAKAFRDSGERIADLGRERARGIVARIPAEPGWRACIVVQGEKLDGGLTMLKLALVPITHWGIPRPYTTFGPFAVAVASWGSFTGASAAPPVPMSEDGLALDVDGFWGLAAPQETDEDMAAKFRAKIAKSAESSDAAARRRGREAER